MGPAQVAQLEQRRRGARRARGPRWKRRAVLAADHQLDDFVVALRSGGIAGDAPAVAEHRAFVGQLGDLVHPVRDVEQRHAVAAQPLQDGVDPGHVGRRQRRRRLVEDQDARLPGQGLGDLDQLASRQRKLLDQCQRMDVLGAGPRQRRFGHAALGTAVDQAEAARRIADGDVVGHRQIGDQRQLLEDAGDARRLGRCRRWERDRLAVEQHPAFIGHDDAGHDLDQGRLAGAVLAQHGMDPAGLDHQLGAVERAHAAVALRNAFHHEQAHPATSRSAHCRRPGADVRPGRNAAFFLTCSPRSGP